MVKKTTVALALIGLGIVLKTAFEESEPNEDSGEYSPTILTLTREELYENSRRW